MCVPNTLGHTCAGLLAAKGASPGESNMSRCCRGRTKNEKFLLSAIAVKFFFFFFLQLISLGCSRGEEKERLGGEGGLLDTSGPLLCIGNSLGYFQSDWSFQSLALRSRRQLSTQLTALGK